MDEGIEVRGDLISDQACISEHKMIHDLVQKGFGEIDQGKLFLKSFEIFNKVGYRNLKFKITL